MAGLRDAKISAKRRFIDLHEQLQQGMEDELLSPEDATMIMDRLSAAKEQYHNVCSQLLCALSEHSEVDKIAKLTAEKGRVDTAFSDVAWYFSQYLHEEKPDMFDNSDTETKVPFQRRSLELNLTENLEGSMPMQSGTVCATSENEAVSELRDIKDDLDAAESRLLKHLAELKLHRMEVGEKIDALLDKSTKVQQTLPMFEPGELSFEPPMTSTPFGTTDHHVRFTGGPSRISDHMNTVDQDTAFDLGRNPHNTVTGWVDKLHGLSPSNDSGEGQSPESMHSNVSVRSNRSNMILHPRKSPPLCQTKNQSGKSPVNLWFPQQLHRFSDQVGGFVGSPRMPPGLQSRPAEHAPPTRDQYGSVSGPYSWPYKSGRPTDTHHGANIDQENVSRREEDMLRQLSRIPLPEFSGDKRKFPTWWSTFSTCVDQTSMSVNAKWLKLHNCLKGDAAKLIEYLTFSPDAYEAVKYALQEQYGGARRQLTVQMSDFSEFKQLKEGDSAGLQSFGALMDRLILQLRSSGQSGDLESGAFFIMMQRKLTVGLLVEFQDWLLKEGKVGSVLTLREFVRIRSVVLTHAKETVFGIGEAVDKPGRQRDRKGGGRTLAAVDNTTKAVDKKKPNAAQVPSRKPTSKCKMCRQDHRLWECPQFKELSTSDRWVKVKEWHACFRCLGFQHRSEDCKYRGTCGIDYCSARHNQLLHEKSGSRGGGWKPDSAGGSGKQDSKTLTATKDSSTSPKEADSKFSGAAKPRVGDSTSLTIAALCSDDGEVMALRTVPVWLSHNQKKVEIVALLDEASTRSYIGLDVATALGFEWREGQSRLLHGEHNCH